MKHFVRMIAAACCALAAAGAVACAKDADANWRAVEVAAIPHVLRGDAGADEALVAGRLTYRGGVELTSPDPDFGGFSALSVSPDGRGLLAVSDRAQWLAAGLVYDDKGRLAGLAGARMAALTGADGAVISGANADAEGLALADGDALVSFEREPRVDAYRIGADGLLNYADRRLDLTDVKELRNNDSLESVAQLADGRLVTIAEGGKDGDAPSRTGWILNGEVLSTFTYRPAKDFNLSDAHAGSDGGVYFLERAYSRLKGVRINVKMTHADEIAPGADLAAAKLAEFGPLYAIDNFEGLAARKDILGRTFLYLISDDNFSDRQKTLLLMFELTDAAE
ncbi:MAG: esterase-like activity of phytase family protein [Parvularculaceae bacterium]